MFELLWILLGFTALEKSHIHKFLILALGPVEKTEKKMPLNFLETLLFHWGTPLLSSKAPVWDPVTVGFFYLFKVYTKCDAVSALSPDHIFLIVLRSHVLTLASFAVQRDWDFWKSSSLGFFLFNSSSYSLLLLQFTLNVKENQNGTLNTACKPPQLDDQVC